MIKKLVVYGVTDKFLKYIESWGFQYMYNWHKGILTIFNIPVRYCKEWYLCHGLISYPAGVWMEVEI